MTTQAATGNDSANESAPMQPASIWTHPALWIVLIACVVGVLGIVVRTRMAGPPPRVEPLPTVATIPDFTLLERSGRTVTRDDLLGGVWVANFIFTSCRGPCPELTLRMRSLSRTLQETNRDVRVVSITVDPEIDTPAVLARYADRHHADPDRWWFLTGERERDVRKLVREGFLQALAPATQSGPIIHSTRVVLIDRQGRIRGWHDGLDATAKPLILRDLDALLAEPDADD